MLECAFSHAKTYNTKGNHLIGKQLLPTGSGDNRVARAIVATPVRRTRFLRRTLYT
jgi:hypothetical protein